MATTPQSPRTAARARELLVLASMMAVVLWGIAIIDATSGTSRGRLSGLPIGTDFIQFYTLAHIGHDSRYPALADIDSFHAEQMRVVPGFDATVYPPVYPPQLALLLSPLARLTYWQAYYAWVVLSLSLYGVIVWRLVRATPALARWPRQVTAVAAASPALWFVALHGQVSVLALAALAMSWAGLQHRRPWLAGFALGALAFKPSLYVPGLALLVAAREWKILTGAVAGTVTLLVASLPWVGEEPIRQYVANTLNVLSAPDQVATNPPLMHSLRTFWTGLFAPRLSTVLYGASALAIVAYGTHCWKRAGTASEQIGVLSMVTVLVTPHLFAYDLVVLTPLVIASATRLLVFDAVGWLRPLTYLGFLSPIWGVPPAFLGLQASTLALAAWFAAFGARFSPLRSIVGNQGW
jgi:hypothetical protein